MHHIHAYIRSGTWCASFVSIPPPPPPTSPSPSSLIASLKPTYYVTAMCDTAAAGASGLPLHEEPHLLPQLAAARSQAPTLDRRVCLHGIAPHDPMTDAIRPCRTNYQLYLSYLSCSYSYLVPPIWGGSTVVVSQSNFLFCFCPPTSLKKNDAMTHTHTQVS